MPLEKASSGQPASLRAPGHYVDYETDVADNKELAGLLARQYSVRLVHAPEQLKAMRKASNELGKAVLTQDSWRLATAYNRWENIDMELHRFIHGRILDLNYKVLTDHQVENVEVAVEAEFKDYEHAKHIPFLFDCARIVNRHLCSSDPQEPATVVQRLRSLHQILDGMERVIERYDIQVDAFRRAP